MKTPNSSSFRGRAHDAPSNERYDTVTRYSRTGVHYSTQIKVCLHLGFTILAISDINIELG